MLHPTDAMTAVSFPLSMSTAASVTIHCQCHPHGKVHYQSCCQCCGCKFILVDIFGKFASLQPALQWCCSTQCQPQFCHGADALKLFSCFYIYKCIYLAPALAAPSAESCDTACHLARRWLIVFSCFPLSNSSGIVFPFSIAKAFSSQHWIMDSAAILEKYPHQSGTFWNY